MNKEDIVKKYKGKTLAFTVYTGGRGDYLVDDFVNFDQLEYPVLGEVNDHETDITEDGVSFLREYYGFENLAQKLFDAEWYRSEYPSVESLLSFLGNLNPYGNANFIANVHKGADAMEILNNDKDKMSEVRSAIESIINSIDSFNDNYSNLNEEDKIDFVTQSYGLIFSYPNDVPNFIMNLDNKLGKVLIEVGRSAKKKYANQLFEHFKPEDSFPVNKKEDERI